MTPVSLCIRKVDHASVITDSTVVARVSDALNELESAYLRPSERIVALEEVLQDFGHSRQVKGTPFGRFLATSIQRRQNKISRIYT